MPFSTVKSSLAKAEALLDQLRLRQLDELLDIGALMFGHLARTTESYRNMVPFCTIIMEHFESELAHLVGILEGCDGAESAKSSYGKIQERVFCLVEDMALFAREKKLRSGCVEQAEPEERLMAYFEASGHWHPEQRIQVTDMYYTQIPAAVMGTYATSGLDSENRGSLQSPTA